MRSRLPTLLAVSALAVFVTYETVPQGDAGSDPVDVLLVLGMPTKPDGTPSQAEVWRVTEAVHEFKLGHAKNILLSGGAAATRFVEANATHQVRSTARSAVRGRFRRTIFLDHSGQYPKQ